MVTKLAAARIAIGAGCRMVIADGRAACTRWQALDDGARCTWFLPDGLAASPRASAGSPAR